MANGAEHRRETASSIDMAGMEKIKLTARQQLFVEYYLATGCRNGAEAMRETGYTGKNPYVAASAMLKKPNVKKYIQLRKKQVLQQAGINAYNVLIEVARIAFADIRLLYNDDNTLKNIADLPDNAAAALESIETDEIRNEEGRIVGYTKKVKMSSKLKALELLMRFKGLLKEKEKDDTINLNNFNVTLDLGNGNKLITNKE